MLKDLVTKNRSYRRFDSSVAIDRAVLVDLVELARCSASGRNIQPLKYYLACSPELNAVIFPTLSWAGYLKDWGGPKEGERPTGYIIMLGDTSISQNFGIDPGIAAQTMLLGAVEKGLGGCIIATIQRKNLAEALHLPETLEILYVLALGKPVEQVVIDPLGADGDIKYWRDAQAVHHVPKRGLQDLIIS